MLLGPSSTVGSDLQADPNAVRQLKKHGRRGLLMLQLHLLGFSYYTSKFECPGNDRVFECKHYDHLGDALVMIDMFGDLRKL